MRELGACLGGGVREEGAQGHEKMVHALATLALRPNVALPLRDGPFATGSTTALLLHTQMILIDVVLLLLG